jgi:4'-phosphopantetheinyl transferase EntD
MDFWRSSVHLDCARIFTVLAGGSISALQHEATGDEGALLANALAPRQREVRAGRSLARLAIKALGLDAGPIGSLISGAPIWPSGCVGSISHSATTVVVIAARQDRYLSVGIDLLDGRTLGPEAYSLIAGQNELRQLQRAGHLPDVESAAQLAFSLKEAIYKCQYPLHQYETLGFREVTLGVSGPGLLEISHAERPLKKMDLEIRTVGGHLVACAYVHRDV